MTETLAAEPISEILNAVGVQRIIAIDDTYAEHAPVAAVINALRGVAPEVASSVFTEFEEIDFAGNVEVRDDAIRERWPSLMPERRVQILEELRAKSSETDDTDKISKDDLANLFAGWDFRALSYAEWSQQKADIIKDESLALLLIDEDFSKEGMTNTQGLEIAKEILAATSAAHVLCVLLSHKYLGEDIHGQWERLCDAQGFDKSRFVLIPKVAIDEDPATFARLIKLATIAKPIDSLRSEMTKIVLSAFKEASRELAEIDIYDMDEIVFGSSWKQGVWEPETLLRVFALFHRKQTRKLSLSNDDLHKIASEVRRVSTVDTTSEKQPPHRIWPIQHLELYDDAQYVNSLHLPISLGDIFRKEGGKEYILIAPPCDLMVRNTGNRAESIKEGILTPIVTGIKDERKPVCWEMGYYLQGSTYYADLKGAFSVKLSGLDLVCLQQRWAG